MKRIVIVTVGQPATNPRMVKEYVALKKAGYKVKVLYAHWANWAISKDEELFATNSIFDKKDFSLIGGNPHGQPLKFLFSRILFRVFRVLSFKFSLPVFDKWALNRPGYFLARAAKREKADLYIAHNLAALPAAVKAARANNALCGFDAEDFHRGQYSQPSGQDFSLTCKIEDQYIALCNYVTAASPLIEEAYRDLLHLKNTLVVNNVFSLSNLQREPAGDDQDNELRMFWFSQTIGSGRGLEEVITALEALKEYNIKLTLLGECSTVYRNELLSRLSKSSMLEFLDPHSPDEIFQIASKAHIGIASEEHKDLNRELCLTNKIFTYLLAGNCIIASDTRAQKKLLSENDGIGLLYQSGNVAHLTEQIKTLYDDRVLLNRYRRKAWDLARTTLNWEIESKKLIELINKVLVK